jgi:hypothetical protein
MTPRPPMGPSFGLHRPDVSIAPHLVGSTCSLRCARPVARPNLRSAADRKNRRCGLPVPAARFENYGQSTPKHDVSIGPVGTRSTFASGVTTCAGCSSCSREGSRVPVPGVHGSTTPSNPKNSHPTGNRHPHRRNNSTMSRRSDMGWWFVKGQGEAAAVTVVAAAASLTRWTVARRRVDAGSV